MDKIDKIILMAVIFALGLLIGYNYMSSQVTKQYEDGSFIGCKYGGLCRD